MRPGTPLRYCLLDRPAASRVTTAENLKRCQVPAARCRFRCGRSSARRPTSAPPPTSARGCGTASAWPASSGSKSGRVPYSGSRRDLVSWQFGHSTFPLTGASHETPWYR